MDFGSLTADSVHDIYTNRLFQKSYICDERISFEIRDLRIYDFWIRTCVYTFSLIKASKGQNPYIRFRKRAVCIYSPPGRRPMDHSQYLVYGAQGPRAADRGGRSAPRTFINYKSRGSGHSFGCPDRGWRRIKQKEDAALQASLQAASSFVLRDL